MGLSPEAVIGLDKPIKLWCCRPPEEAVERQGRLWSRNCQKWLAKNSAGSLPVARKIRKWNQF